MDGIYWTRSARERVWSTYRAMLATSPVAMQEGRIQTRNGETCVFTCGPPQAAPLVLLHGGNVNSAMWLRSLPTWSKHFRVHAVDVIGDPGFSAPTRPPCRTDEHALWLEEVFSSLKMERAHIVGASFGGWIALDFATRRPGAVDRLVLLAPAGVVRVSTAATIQIATLMLMGAWGRDRALLRLFGLVDTSLTEDQQSFLAFCGVVQRNALSRLEVPAPIADEQLGRLSARTLAVLGGRDIPFSSDAAGRRLRELCPTATVQTIPDAGHALVDPTDLVQEFLSR